MIALPLLSNAFALTTIYSISHSTNHVTFTTFVYQTHALLLHARSLARCESEHYLNLLLL